MCLEKAMTKKPTLLFCSLLLLVGCGGSSTATDVQKEIYVDVYDSEKAGNGTTLFAALHDPQNPRIKAQRICESD